MLNIILPPIVIAVGIGLLAWLFYRKRHLFLGDDNGSMRKAVYEDDVAKPSVVQKKERRGLFFSGQVKKLKEKQENLKDRLSYFQKLAPKDATKEDGVIGDVKKSSVLNKKVASLTKREHSKKEKLSVREIKKGLNVVDKSKEKELVKKKQETSKKVVDERPKPEKKEKYENILIERIALNPRDLEAYERLGDYYIEQQEYGDAKECYKQVLKLSPVNRKARVRMKKLEKVLGKRP